MAAELNEIASTIERLTARYEQLSNGMIPVITASQQDDSKSVVVPVNTHATTQKDYIVLRVLC